MKKFTSWLTVILVICFLLPMGMTALISQETTNEPTTGTNAEINNELDVEDKDIDAEKEKPYYPKFPELPPPPAPGSPFYAEAYPPPSYMDESNRASRIRVTTNTVIAIDQPKAFDFVSLGQNFVVRGGLYEDNNSNGKNDTGDVPIENAKLYLRWAFAAGQQEIETDSNGRFEATVTNNNPNLKAEAYPLEIEFWGHWTINGSVFYQIPRNASGTNIPGYDDDGDNPEYTIDGKDNDRDWKGWDGTSWNNDTNHDGNASADWDGVANNDDDLDGLIDEEWSNGIDDDGDGRIDEDCEANSWNSTDDGNGDGLPAVDPEPNLDEWDEGIDEEGVPNGRDDDDDLQIDEDCYLPFIPRQNTTAVINLIIQHRTEITLSTSPKNSKIWNEVNLSGKLQDTETSTPITGRWIILKFHGNVIDYVQTDAEGKYKYKYQIPGTLNGDKIDVGRRQFTAVFDPNYIPDNSTYYKSSSKSADVVVSRQATIEITDVYKDVYLQDTISISGRVYDETGSPPRFSISHDDGSKTTVESSNYKITVNWGKSVEAWAPPPIPGALGPNGNFTVKFTLNNPLQPLGPVDVSASFIDVKNNYYLKDDTTDEYSVRAHSRIIDWEEVKGFHRGDTAYIRGRLIRQDGAIVEALSDAQLEARWGPGVPFENLTDKTRNKGEFTYEHFIESDHQLGPIVVYMRFDGTNYLQGYVDGFDHTESFARKTYYVIAKPQLSMKGGNIIKGEDVTFEGKLVDDDNRPMANQYVEIYFSSKPIINKETGEWEPEDPPIAFIPTDSAGEFKYEYIVPESQEVGIAYGAARFKGFQPPYNTTNAYDEALTHNVIFNVSAYTAIVVDEIYVDIELERDRDFTISGRLYETYKGGLTPTKVKPLHNEKLKVKIFLVADGVEEATYHEVGEASILKLGTFTGRAKVPADIEVTEYLNLILQFDGNLRYQQATNSSIHKLWSYVFFDRSAILDSFTDDDEGRKAVFEDKFNHKSKNYEGPLVIKVPIYQDLQGQAPPPVPNATVYLNFSEAYFVNSSVAITDENGIATFTFVNPLQDKDYPEKIKLLHSDKMRYVLEVSVTFVGAPGLQPATTTFNITYFPTPPPEQIGIWEKYRTVISILIIVTIVLVIFMIAFSSYYIKQQRLQGLKRIIKRAADQLIAGDQYRATIYKSYKKLSAHLRRYGYLRREAETFREFETAIRQALPIDRMSMHRFLDLLEEARYSSHKIGENQRTAAISNLRAIEGSLSQIIIDEEAAMRALRKLEEEEASMAAAETEIIVKPGAEGGAMPPQMPPGGAGGPPKKLPPGV